MYLALIVGGAIAIFLLCWVLLRVPPPGSAETTRTVLSSDLFTKIMLVIIAISTFVIALQGFLSPGIA